MEESSEMRSNIDLFSAYEFLPEEVQEAINMFDENVDEYNECRKLEERLKPLGYTFEWYLDGVPYDLFADDPLVQEELESKASKVLELEKIDKYSYPKMRVSFKNNEKNTLVKTMDIVENINNSELLSEELKNDMLEHIHQNIRVCFFNCKDGLESKRIKADEVLVSDILSNYSKKESRSKK